MQAMPYAQILPTASFSRHVSRPRTRPTVQLKFNRHPAESQLPGLRHGCASVSAFSTGQNAMLTFRFKRETSRHLCSLSAALALVLILDACASTTGTVPG